jgi:hypothetical protein
MPVGGELKLGGVIAAYYREKGVKSSVIYFLTRPCA